MDEHRHTRTLHLDVEKSSSKTDPACRHAPSRWYVGDLPRAKTEAIVCSNPHGAFLVRQSSNGKHYVICVCDNGTAMHFEVRKGNNCLQFANKEWNTLLSVVEFLQSKTLRGKSGQLLRLTHPAVDVRAAAAPPELPTTDYYDGSGETTSSNSSSGTPQEHESDDAAGNGTASARVSKGPHEESQSGGVPRLQIEDTFHDTESTQQYRRTPLASTSASLAPTDNSSTPTPMPPSCIEMTSDHTSLAGYSIDPRDKAAAAMTMPPSSAPPSDVALLKRGQSCPTALGTTRSPTSGASPDPPVGTGRGVGGDGGSSAVDTQSKARRGSDNGTEADIVPRTRRRSASTSAGSGTGSMPPNRPASRSGSNFSDEQCSPTLARAMIDDEVAGIDVGGDEDSVLSVLRTSPATRTPDGVQRIVDEMERFSSFAAKPESLRRRVCALMEFSAFSRGDMVCTGSDVLDFWWFVLAGTVQVAASAEDGTTTTTLGEGEAFGHGADTGNTAAATRSSLVTVIATTDGCHVVRVPATDYARSEAEGERDIARIMEGGALVAVTERHADATVVIKGAPRTLTQALFTPHRFDTHNDAEYVGVFLLVYRTFTTPPCVLSALLHHLRSPASLVAALGVAAVWVEHYYVDFEASESLRTTLRTAIDRIEAVRDGVGTAEESLGTDSNGADTVDDWTELHHVQPPTSTEARDVISRLRADDRVVLEHAVYTVHAALLAHTKTRQIVLTRAVNDEALGFKYRGGKEFGCGFFVSHVYDDSHAQRHGLRVGDEILAVNGNDVTTMSSANADLLIMQYLTIKLDVRHNLSGLRLFELNPHRRSGSQGSLDLLLIPKSDSSEDLWTSQDEDVPRKRLGSRGLSRMSLNRMFKPKRSGEDLPIFKLQYDFDSSEHAVLRVHRPGESSKLVAVSRKSSVQDIIIYMTAQYNLSAPEYSICVVSVDGSGLVKQTMLPESLNNLHTRIKVNTRIYLKCNQKMEVLLTEDGKQEVMAKYARDFFFSLEASAVARELTITNHDLYGRIAPLEYVNYLWNPEAHDKCINLQCFTDRFNAEVAWVVDEVCAHTDSHKKRADAIKKFIKIARLCFQANNFNSLFAIVSGLAATPVSRLKQTWERLPSKYTEYYAQLESLMDPSRNMAKYRQALEKASGTPPLIPFFPLLMKDLAFLHEGNDSKSEGLVNFDKLRTLAKRLKDMRLGCRIQYNENTLLWRKAPTNLTVKSSWQRAEMVREARFYLEQTIGSGTDLPDRDQQMKQSYACEPSSRMLQRLTEPIDGRVRSYSVGAKSNSTLLRSQSQPAMRVEDMQRKQRLPLSLSDPADDEATPSNNTQSALVDSRSLLMLGEPHRGHNRLSLVMEETTLPTCEDSPPGVPSVSSEDHRGAVADGADHTDEMDGLHGLIVPRPPPASHSDEAYVDFVVPPPPGLDTGGDSDELVFSTPPPENIYDELIVPPRRHSKVLSSDA